MGRWSRKGFTVVELVIVVIVIAILAAIVVVAYRGVTGSAQEASIKSDLQANAAKVARHKAKNGSYPTSSSSLDFVTGSGRTLAYDGGGQAFCISLQDESSGKIFSIDESDKIANAGCTVRWKSGKFAVNYHACGVSVQDQAFCWGRGDVGQIGNGNTNQRTSPTLIERGAIPAGVVVSSIDVGNSHTCALGSNAWVYCWGGNASGQLGDGTTTQRNTPVAIQRGAIPSGVTITQLVLGASHSCVLASNNQMYCWGSGGNGQLGNGANLSVSAPSAVLQGAIPTGLTIQRLDVEDYHSCALASNAWLYCWGGNGNGQLGIGTSPSSSNTPVALARGVIPGSETILSFATGGTRSCVIASNSRAYCWGYNHRGQLGDGTTTQRETPVAVSTSDLPAGVTFRTITLGNSHSCADASNNQLYCWGLNSYGQIGNGTTGERILPTQATSVTLPSGRVSNQIFGGFNTMCALAENQRAYCWGGNAYGQFGNGTTTSSLSATPVLGQAQ